MPLLQFGDWPTVAVSIKETDAKNGVGVTVYGVGLIHAGDITKTGSGRLKAGRLLLLFSSRQRFALYCPRR